ncbi:uncharacterized protein [Amphiura filiformis]|uniref:uncharacterized protein n=1 Tax=Amphiura filiformis TaxID=82378 RepID=UPI003B219203
MDLFNPDTPSCSSTTSTRRKAVTNAGVYYIWSQSSDEDRRPRSLDYMGEYRSVDRITCSCDFKAEPVMKNFGIFHTDLVKMPPGLDYILQNEAHSDITIKVDDKLFKAHKSILVASSDYFKTMFSAGFKEANMNEIELHVPGQSEVFETLLEFIYSGKMSYLTSDTAVDILGMAGYLQMDQAVELCCEAILHWYARNLMSLERALEICQHPEENLSFLILQSKYYIAVHLRKTCGIIPETLECLKMCMETVSDMINDDHRFIVMMKWLEQNWEDRKQHAYHLLHKIKIADLSRRTMIQLGQNTQLQEVVQVNVIKTEHSDEQLGETLSEILKYCSPSVSYYDYYDDEDIRMIQEGRIQTRWVNLVETSTNQDLQSTDDIQPVQSTRKTEYTDEMLGKLDHDYMVCSTMANRAGKVYRKHLVSVYKELSQQRSEETYCDVDVRVDGRIFKAHKSVLMICCNYFKELLTDPQTHKIEIDGESETFERLLNALYTGKIEGVSTDTLMSTLDMASKLQLHSVIDTLKLFVSELTHSGEMSLDMAQQICKREEPGLSSIQEICKDYTKASFVSLVECHPGQASIEYLTEHLDEMKKPDESKFVQFLLNWLTHSWEERKQHAHDLLKKVRLGVLSDDLLKKLQEMTSDIVGCRKMLMEVMKLKATTKTPQRLQDIPLYISHPHWFATRTTITAMVALGGRNHSNEYYHGSWRKANMELPEPLTQHASVVINGHLCIAGGRIQVNGSWNRCTEAFRWYDMQSKQWKPLASMHQRRRNFPLVFMDGYAYAIGGGWRYGMLVECERYSVMHNSWEKLPPMPIACKYHSAVAYDGVILVYGSKKGSMTNEHVLQRFTPSWRGSGGSWQVLMSENITLGSIDLARPVLTVQKEQLYRVAYGKNQNRAYVSKVDQVSVGFNSATTEEDQCLDKRDSSSSFHPIIFCIDSQLYAIVHGCVFDLERQVGCSELHLRHITNTCDKFGTASVAIVSLDPPVEAEVESSSSESDSEPVLSLRDIVISLDDDIAMSILVF